MRINIATLFPEMCDAVLNTSIIGRAKNAGKVEIKTYNIRDYTLNKHRNVDDTPYGGGGGMVLRVEPLYDAINDMKKDSDDAKVILLTPDGIPYKQTMAVDLSKEKHLIFVCGHYEGFDERIYTLADELVSIGDFIFLTIYESFFSYIGWIFVTKCLSATCSYASGVILRNRMRTLQGTPYTQ